MQVPISEIASHYTELKPMGPGTWQCVCPFHDDKNPSMGLSDDKGLYNCFSCGASGNTITFVKNMDDLSFVDAVRKVTLTLITLTLITLTLSLTLTLTLPITHTPYARWPSSAECRWTPPSSVPCRLIYRRTTSCGGASRTYSTRQRHGMHI